MCEGFFLGRIPKNADAGSSRAVDPPPHLPSKCVEYSTDL